MVCIGQFTKYPLPPNEQTDTEDPDSTCCGGETDSERGGDLVLHKTSPWTRHSLSFPGPQLASQVRAVGPRHPTERKSCGHEMPRPQLRSRSQAREKAGLDMSVVLADTEGKPGHEEKRHLKS